MTTAELRPVESRVRKLARRMGYRASKSRQKDGLNNFGKFQLIDSRKNVVVLGSLYQASLEHIITYLEDNGKA